MIIYSLSLTGLVSTGVINATAAETAQEPEFASMPSLLYTGDDEPTETEPQPQPPSFSMAHLPAAPMIKLKTLNSDEIARLRPNAQGLTPIGVHRKLPPDLIQDVLPDNLDTANKDTNNKDNLLPVPQPRSQTKPKSTRTHSLVQGAWQWVGNGRLWRAQIHSPGASGLRLHFQDFNVGTGRVWLHTLDRSAAGSSAGSGSGSSSGLSVTGGDEVYGPYTGRGMYDDGDFWSDIVFNSRLTIEYQPGPEDTNVVDRGPVPFRIQNISHLTNLNLGRPSARQFGSTTGSAAMQKEAAANAPPKDRLTNQNAYNFNNDKSSYNAAQNDLTTYPPLQPRNQSAPFQNQSPLLKIARQDRTNSYDGGLLTQMAASARSAGLPRRDAALCQVDVSCYYETWGDAAKGVARIIIGSNGRDGLCSGVLLKPNGSQIPYFLTAAHCVKTDAVARSIEFWWFYESSGCYSTNRDSRFRRTRGAHLLQTTGEPRRRLDQRGDVTLLRLTQNPPTNVHYQRWTPSAQSTGDSVVGIHHPGGPSDTGLDGLADLKRISLGSLVWPSGTYLGVQWIQGTVENGSSGSPLFNSSKQVIGILAGSHVNGFSGRECIVGQTDEYTKFSFFYPKIRQWLNPEPGSVTPPPDPPPPPPSTSPTISSFTASPSSITNGSCTNLRWQSSNGTSANINQGVGRVSPVNSGTKRVCPTQTTTYTLTVTRSSGCTSNCTATRTAQVTVRANTAEPRITFFVVYRGARFNHTSLRIERGQTVTLEWATENTNRVTLSGHGTVPAVGKRTAQPTTSTTYTLIATHSNGRQKTQRVHVNVRAPATVQAPEITSFTATKQTVWAAGTQPGYMLRWQTRNATGLRIEPNVGTVTHLKSVVVRPTQTTTYTLTATKNNAPTATQSVTITITPPITPHITSFTQPTTITRGQSVTLRWTSTSATSASLTNIGAVPTSGERSVSPQNTTTYTLTIKSSTGHTATRRVTITVKVPKITPRIDRFRASTHNITAGQSVTLSWSSSKASRASISGVGTVPTSGTRVVRPSVTTTYTLTVTSSTNTPSTRALIINVKPKINSFTVSSPSIARGQSVTLRWSTSGSRNVTISNLGTLPTSGSRTVSPTKTTTYTLRISSADGLHSATASRTVRVLRVIRPEIVSFTPSRSSITSGQNLTLSWSTRNATRASISGIGTVPTSGTRSVSPTRTTTYRLTVNSLTDHSDVESVTVTVKPARITPQIISFKPSKETIVRGQSVTLSWQVTNATRVQITPQGGTFSSSSGSTAVQPTEDTTYTLTAISSTNHDTTETVRVLVTTPVDTTIGGGTLYPNTPKRWRLGPVESPTLYYGSSNSYQITVPTNATRLSFDLQLDDSTKYVSLFVRRGQRVGLENHKPIADHEAERSAGNKSLVITPNSSPALRAGTYYIALGLISTDVVVSGQITARIQTRSSTTTGPTTTGEPKILSFTTSKAALPHRQSTTLRWNTEGARSVRIESKTLIGGPVQCMDCDAPPTGWQTLAPAYSTTYTLTVTNSQGHTAKKSIDVTMGNPTPLDNMITSFTADKYSIRRGESVNLKWRASAAAVSSQIDRGPRHPASFFESVKPTRTTPYKLKVHDAHGNTQTQTITIEVR